MMETRGAYCNLGPFADTMPAPGKTWPLGQKASGCILKASEVSLGSVVGSNPLLHRGLLSWEPFCQQLVLFFESLQK